MRGELANSGVEAYERIVYNTHLYPNPAGSTLHISSVDYSCPVSVIDVLGREVLRSALDAHGEVLLNVASLPRGIYCVMLEHSGLRIPIGKVALIARD